MCYSTVKQQTIESELLLSSERGGVMHTVKLHFFTLACCLPLSFAHRSAAGLLRRSAAC
jgi:hypothetical protein